MTADEFRFTSAAGKPESRLFRHDVLACIEFKGPTKKLPKPPPSYEVKEYMPTDPEVRCVEPPRNTLLASVLIIGAARLPSDISASPTGATTSSLSCGRRWTLSKLRAGLSTRSPHLLSLTSKRRL